MPKIVSLVGDIYLSCGADMPKLDTVISDLYASEINFDLSSFWDGGYTAKIGDRINGYKESSEMLVTLEEVAEELTRMAIKHYPKSEFAEKYS